MERGAKSARTARSVASGKPPATRHARPTLDADRRTVDERLADAIAQQAATADILRVMSASPADIQPTVNAVARHAARLCRTPFARVFIAEGDVLRLLAHHADDGKPSVLAEDVPLRRTSVSGRATLDRATVHHADVVPLLDDDYPDARPNALAQGMRAMLAVPLVHQGEARGAILIWRREPGLFSPDQVALVETFAVQAAIAIAHVRLFRATREALEQQTATSDILRVISQSPTDAQPVFETIAQAALQLCRASSANVFTYDGQLVHLAAYVNVNQDYAELLRREFPRPLSRETAVLRAIETRSVVAIPDVLDDRDYAILRQQAASGGFRSVLAVPLMRDGNAIGGIVVGRPEPGPFPGTQVALLQTFADQAVIAIENVRLFNELEARNRDLTESLEQQIATSDILRVISRSPTDVQPIFETIAQAARKLCRADSANVFTYDGELVHLAAFVNLNQDYAEHLRRAFPRPLSRETAVLRAIETRAVVVIPDVLEDRDYAILRKPSASGGFRSVLAVPLLRDGNAIGGIAVGRPEPGPFPATQVALLQTFADQAVIAVENVRLFKELEARTRELTRSVGELRALGEVGQAVSSTLDLETVLSTIVTRARQLTGMDAGAIYEYDEAREEFYLHTADCMPDELVEVLRSAPIRKGEGVLGRLAVTAELAQVRDIMDEASYQSRIRELLVKLGYRSLLAVPLLRNDHLLGGLVVNRKHAGEFDKDVIALLRTFATQSALAIQNARLFRELEAKGRQLEIASKHKSEFLANMSHELRTPLNAIIGFSEVLAERLFGEVNDKQAEYVHDIHESGQHLLALINDILDLSKVEAGRMELDAADVDVANAIRNTLTLLRERAQRRGIALTSDIDADAGTVLADQRKVKQVLLNLLSNALKFTPEGGVIAVRARGFPDRIEVGVTDTGVGIAPADQATLFEEFRQVGASAKRVEGTGLGLAISRKFVELHGGTIRVESEPGRGSTFTFTLPRR